MKLQDAITAVKANPRDPAAWVALGDAMAETGETDKARESYQRALKIAPEHAQALAGIARLDLPPLAVPPEMPKTIIEPLPEPAPWKPIESVSAGAGLEPGQRRWDHGRAGRGREWDTPVAVERTGPSMAAYGCGAFAILSIACLVLVSYLPDSPDGSSSGAWSECQGAISQRLKAPATAQFPPYSNEYVSYSGAQQWYVSSYVDSQNSFGAMVRTHFACKLEYTGRSWLVLDVEFE